MKKNKRIIGRITRRHLELFGAGLYILAELLGDHSDRSKKVQPDKTPRVKRPGFISDIDFEDIKKTKNDNC